MNKTIRRCLRLGLGAAAIFATLLTPKGLLAADGYVPFDGPKTTWHEGFDRYDFIMDDATGAITPMTAPASEVTGFSVDVKLTDGKRRCVVVVPKKAAPGYPWSWQGCYWNHQPQTEVELLKRGFHIAFVAPDAGRQGKAWDTWYKFLTEKHGLAKKSAFIGMSKGGVNEFNWGGANPDKVACIYADNPGLYDDSFATIPELAKHDIPLLHICGTEDWMLQLHTQIVENIYHQLGGAITVMIKEGHAHHPHSLQNAKPIADWIEQHMTPSTANRPAFVDENFTKSYYYSLEPSFIYLKEEDTYATARGPGFTECYDRYDKGYYYAGARGDLRMGGMAVIVPRTVAPGKPWVLMGDPIERDATVEQALLAKGYHIVIVPLEGTGMVQKEWDDIYKLLVDNGFSSKPVLKGTGAMAGEAYAWAIANPDKVSCIYARNPLMRSLMAKSPPIDNLAPLAKAGVPILHDCGSLDPWLNDQTRVVEKRYKELGGQIRVIIREGEGHFPLAPKDPKTVVDFIISNAN
jgi:pimeloyl-ACP methyl ester carboxylesterase